MIMERSRSDVYQRTIDEQNQKLEKYQTKLRGYYLHSYVFKNCLITVLIWFYYIKNNK